MQKSKYEITFEVLKNILYGTLLIITRPILDKLDKIHNKS